MEEVFNADNYRIEYGAEADPIIVLTGTLEEFQTFQSLTNRTTKQAIAVRQPYQLGLYPGLEIVHFGSFWLNSVYDSPEYKDIMGKNKLAEFDRLEAERKANESK